MSHSITFMLVICLFRSSILLDKVSYQQPKPIKFFLQQFRILSLQFYKNRERKKKESVKSLVTFQDSTLVFRFLYLITINIPTKLTTGKNPNYIHILVIQVSKTRQYGWRSFWPHHILFQERLQMQIRAKRIVRDLSRSHQL